MLKNLAGRERWPSESPVLAQRAASEGPRWTRAVEDQSAPIPEEITSELDWSLIDRGKCSFDACRVKVRWPTE